MLGGPISPAELDELRLDCRFSGRQAAAFLGVSHRTWLRWKRTGAPGWVGAVLRVQSGLPPWDGWEGWRFGPGEMWPPGYRDPVTPGQVMAVPYRLQIIAALQRRIREFEGMSDQEVFQQVLRDRHM